MTKLVNFLMSRNDAVPFLEPVDWRGLELYDYPKIIEKMMDLGTVKRKLERNQYATAHECAQDIRLIWKNCLTYNADGSDFWLLAKNFSRRFEDRYKKIRAEFNVGEDVGPGGDGSSAPDGSNWKSSNNTGDNPQNSYTKYGDGTIPLDSKAQLASNIFLLSGMELAHVITTIENRCPQALDQVSENNNNNNNPMTHQLEINIDALDYKTFADLEKYTRDKVANRHSECITDQITGDMNKGSTTSTSNSTKKRKK